MATKLGEAKNNGRDFGRPSPRKIQKRLQSWREWGNKMSFLHSVHREVDPIIEAQRQALDY